MCNHIEKITLGYPIGLHVIRPHTHVSHSPSMDITHFHTSPTASSSCVCVCLVCAGVEARALSSSTRL